MEITSVLPEKKDDIDKKAKAATEENSLQYNRQDLDQEQKCDVNPVQLNNQNIHIYLSSDKNDYSSKISGVTLYDKSRKAAPNVCIKLFWGHESTYPVYKTHSDADGNFIVDELPPGFYTINAYLGSCLHCKSFIKLLPSQKLHHCILLREQ